MAQKPEIDGGYCRKSLKRGELFAQRRLQEPTTIEPSPVPAEGDLSVVEGLRE